MSHEENDKPNNVMSKMEFAVHLMNGLPIAQVTEGYDYEEWEESMEIIKLMMRRYKMKRDRREATPEFIKKIMFSITGELRQYDIGCLDCSYREYLNKMEA
tara:strand:- start:1288 stop:1590 length:303 start_codon:yes stop_codon:yes gene_type:complete